MAGFVKLQSSLIHSTVWREPNHIRILWITMLAMKGHDGIVEASIPCLADAARITLEECEEGLYKLSSPDKYSRTKEHDGRRIEEIDGGWIILNHEKYRGDTSTERVRKHREKKQCEISRSITERYETQETRETASDQIRSDHKEKNSRKPAQKRLSYSEDFEIFWGKWPCKVKGPKSDAYEQWKKTSTVRPESDRLMSMIEAAERNRFNMVKQGNFVPEWPHLHRWLKKRRWEELEEQQPQTVKMCTLNGIGPMFPLRVPLADREKKIAELAEKGYRSYG